MLLIWLLLRGIVALVAAVVDDLLVITRLKWRPASGRARWRWDTAWRCICIQCDAPLSACDCRPGCTGGVCRACEAKRR